MAHPELAKYLSKTYFSTDGGLTQERVKRCNSACASLFRWCSRSLARVEAALELLLVKAELATLAPPQAQRWRCEADEGWVEYPAEIDEWLCASEAGGGTVAFELHGRQYEVDLGARIQRNFNTRFARPVRPPDDTIDIRALQGTWHSSWGSIVTVNGTALVIDGQPVGPELEQLEDGAVRWVFNGEWRIIGGSPLEVIWAHGVDSVTWSAFAAQAQDYLESAGSRSKPTSPSPSRSNWKPAVPTGPTSSKAGTGVMRRAESRSRSSLKRRADS
eukprot:gnl/TRDRNA2_/TRDRNA2_35566_c0_seq1.p1 gnl/TRDRNA2_/TRDRNA2_35566_c0~~gnl/TRDRNA2_/TRDRNA2_35566_c0_seq1.p1  ORF type:complete len:274 (+),score=39.92 gnl/TRDRNA2_/TRDRNA2_35566_c0_seq1:2-823(+)